MLRYFWPACSLFPLCVLMLELYVDVTVLGPYWSKELLRFKRSQWTNASLLVSSLQENRWTDSELLLVTGTVFCQGSSLGRNRHHGNPSGLLPSITWWVRLTFLALFKHWQSFCLYRRTNCHFQVNRRKTVFFILAGFDGKGGDHVNFHVNQSWGSLHA